jgi:hypothetical protein
VPEDAPREYQWAKELLDHLALVERLLTEGNGADAALYMGYAGRLIERLHVLSFDSAVQEARAPAARARDARTRKAEPRRAKIRQRFAQLKNAGMKPTAAVKAISREMKNRNGGDLDTSTIWQALKDAPAKSE